MKYFTNRGGNSLKQANDTITQRQEMTLLEVFKWQPFLLNANFAGMP